MFHCHKFYTWKLDGLDPLTRIPLTNQNFSLIWQHRSGSQALPPFASDAAVTNLFWWWYGRCLMWWRCEFSDQFIGYFVVWRDLLSLDLLTNFHGEVSKSFALLFPSLSFPCASGEESVWREWVFRLMDTRLATMDFKLQDRFRCCKDSPKNVHKFKIWLIIVTFCHLCLLPSGLSLPHQVFKLFR